jgi:prepilin-type N-terminal cleavage/methylation domain-containing protein
MQMSASKGFTLVETIVALLLFSVGGLALTSTAAIIGRQLKVDDVRERAGRVAVSRLETLRANCRGATSGGELLQGVRSQWSVRATDAARLTLVESVSYTGWTGARSDTYSAVVQCR